MKIGVLVSVRDDGYLERVFADIESSKADAVDRDGAFFDHEFSEFFGEFEFVFKAAVLVFDLFTDGSGINMTLHKMSIDAGGRQEASFKVHLAADGPLMQFRF